MVEILFITFNRLDYTKVVLQSILNDIGRFKDFTLSIFDNASTDGTQEYLKQFEKHPRVEVLRRNLDGYAMSEFKALLALAYGCRTSNVGVDKRYKASIIKTK